MAPALAWLDAPEQICTLLKNARESITSASQPRGSSCTLDCAHRISLGDPENSQNILFVSASCSPNHTRIPQDTPDCPAFPKAACRPAASLSKHRGCPNRCTVCKPVFSPEKMINWFIRGTESTLGIPLKCIWKPSAHSHFADQGLGCPASL